MSADCAFCKIILGELPSYKIAENQDFIAILDIYPGANGHTLVIPKTHCVTMFDMPEDYAAGLLPFAQKVGLALMKATGAEGLNFVQNNGADAGQVVMHYHAHLLPRFKGDGLNLHFPHKKDIISKEDMAALAKKIADKVL